MLIAMSSVCSPSLCFFFSSFFLHYPVCVCVLCSSVFAYTVCSSLLKRGLEAPLVAPPENYLREYCSAQQQTH